MRYLVLVLALFAVAAIAAPPYDVTVTFTAPAVDATHGPPTGYRLYRGCRTGETKVLVGPVTSGQTFTGLLTADGTYSFCVHAINTGAGGAVQQGPSSNVAVVSINDFDPPPGALGNVGITVTCDPSCEVNVVIEPAP